MIIGYFATSTEAAKKAKTIGGSVKCLIYKKRVGYQVIK